MTKNVDYILNLQKRHPREIVMGSILDSVRYLRKMTPKYRWGSLLLLTGTYMHLRPISNGFSNAKIILQFQEDSETEMMSIQINHAHWFCGSFDPTSWEFHWRKVRYMHGNGHWHFRDDMQLYDG